MNEQATEPERARCPECGMPTVPDHEDLTLDEMLCDMCFALIEGREG